MRSRRVFRRSWKDPRRDLPQMKVKPRNAKVSGLLTPRFLRLTAAWRPNSITRVLSGWSDSENASNRSHMPKRLDEEELADWRAGRDAVYQLAAHHGRRATRGRRRINGPSNRKPRRGSRGFEVDDRARGKCDRSPDVSKHRRKPSSSTVSDIYNFEADRPADR